MSKFKKRYKNFKLWYVWLRAEGVRLYGEDQSELAWYAKYSRYNCFWWAVSNSGTHNIDGTYFND